MRLTKADMVSAIASSGLSGRQVTCSTTEMAIMQPPSGQTCGQYLQTYADEAMGAIYNPNATSDCEFCPARDADQFLKSVSISYSTEWRDYGIGFAYIFFNIFMAVVLYYMFRVRKSSGKSMGARFAPLVKIFNRRKDVKTTSNETQEEQRVDESNTGPVLPQ
jgi:ATP-binding cassette subfamily G (WHITE) protein 2 (PDR)